ncbi:MAG: undecaprenyl-diphosphatase UppP [bacterium]|nr:undecaprenyl-diphosphatase UppP [bacterium]
MDFLRAIILGVVQALTEFLPVSSSAHLILFREWLGFDSVDGLTFDVALHVGTLLAIVTYFRREMRGLVRGAGRLVTRPGIRNDVNQRLVVFIVAATIPAALAGFFLDDWIEAQVRSLAVIVVTLIVGGILFIIADRYAKPLRKLDGLSFTGAMLIGVAQSIALIPGVSRSGITIVAGMSQKLGRVEAARFSFLLSVPILIGAGLKKGIDVSSNALSGGELGLLAVGVLTSAVAGWIVIRFLLRFLQSHGLALFAYYRFVLAVVILVWLTR